MDVREASCEGEEEDVMMGSRFLSARWMARVGNSEGSCAMVCLSVLLAGRSVFFTAGSRPEQQLLFLHWGCFSIKQW